MSRLLGGIDIGGTKCAVTLGIAGDEQITILAKQRFPTPDTPEKAITQLVDTLRNILVQQDQPLSAIGISCGGSLVSKRGGGFGKAGSFEGFCSGGGIQRLATSYARSALKVGKPRSGIWLLIDILNPQRIIIGSIYLRQQALLETAMQAILKQEALSYVLDVCEIMPPATGEAIGD